MWALVVGVALWWASHLFKRIAPGVREGLGESGKGVVAVGSLIAIGLMIVGYRYSDFVHVYAPPDWALHANNLLMLVAIFMMSPAPKRGLILSKMRHPMLTGFTLWALSHLLVNGDLAALVLFGGLGLWSLVAMLVINRTEPGWQPGKAGSLVKDGMFLVASAVLMAVVGYIHGWLGPWPFPG